MTAFTMPSVVVPAFVKRVCFLSPLLPALFLFAFLSALLRSVITHMRAFLHTTRESGTKKEHVNAVLVHEILFNTKNCSSEVHYPSTSATHRAPSVPIYWRKASVLSSLAPPFAPVRGRSRTTPQAERLGISIQQRERKRRMALRVLPSALLN